MASKELTHREYIAIHAPEAPEWFMHPNEPEQPAPELYDDFGGIPNPQEWDAYQAKIMPWRIQREVAWRFAFADAFLAASALGEQSE